jgi:ribose transport system substrate-binding protein
MDIVYFERMENQFLQDLQGHDRLDGKFHDARGSQSEQTSYLKQSLSEGVDFIMTVPIRAEAVAPVVDLARENDVPFICVDRNVTSADPTAYIASDNARLGQQSVDLLYDFMTDTEEKDQYNIIEIQGAEGASVTDERHRGVSEAVGENRVDLLESRSGSFSTSDGADIASDLIEEYGGRIDGIYAHNDLMALGAHRAVSKSRLTDVPITGIDGSKEWVEQFDDECHYGTVAQLPEKMVRTAIDCGLRAVDGETVQDYCQVEGLPVTRGNADKYLGRYF